MVARPRVLMGLFSSAFALACAPGPDSSPPPRVPPTPPSPPSASVSESAPAPAPSTAPAPESVSSPAPDPPPPKIPATGHPFQEPLPPRDLERSSVALRVANLAPKACLAELKRRSLPIERDRGPAQGIAAPVRITGEMHGVRFVAPGKKSVYGKLDCRLALALDELAGVVARHGVVVVRVDNLYRPRARLPGRRTHSQHRYGLAIDLVAFGLEDGSELSVENDWHGERDQPVCGPESRLTDPTERAIALRNVVCDIARGGIFHHILTPSYDAAHRDHLHLDIKRGEKRSFIE